MNFDLIADNENYKKWRQIHKNTFGSIFADAFEDSEQNRIILTSALISISQKQTFKAAEQLETLRKMSNTDFDLAAVNYFLGLTYEITENEERMCDCYEDFLNSSHTFDLPLAFHPYYRSAKNAQRTSECLKAIRLYQKALEFFERSEASLKKKQIASHIIYDIAAVYLYMHQYIRAQKYLDLSYDFSKDTDWQREYVQAILHVLSGRMDECEKILSPMPSLLRPSCENIVRGIVDGTDMHYCIVDQDRSSYHAFCEHLQNSEEKILDMIASGKTAQAEKLISDELTNEMEFAKRPLECKIQVLEGSYTVKCKNYCILTLSNEQNILFEMCNCRLKKLKLVSVSYFDA